VRRSRHRARLRSPAAWLALLLACAGSAGATVGLAEWEVPTPGGNRISHIDPLKSRYGTCLRKADAVPGVLTEPATVYAQHLEWWIYHRDHVVGKARAGFFIFNETNGAIVYFGTEAELAAETQRRQLGGALSKRMTAQDGWNEAWLPVYRERCKAIARDPASLSGVSEDVVKRMKELCASLQGN
jgi:hypothetical protein